LGDMNNLGNRKQETGNRKQKNGAAGILENCG
jgi:hypothetical protein